jgi:tetratricopeptide (TPR) repeat protein
MSNRRVQDSRAAFQRAVVHLQAGNAAAAERVCRDAIRVDASDANLHSLLGAALLRQNRAGEAEQSLGEAIARAPDFAGAYEGRAEARLAQGRLAEGVDDLLKARSLEPRRASVLRKLGEACVTLGDDQTAYDALAELVTIRPGDARTLQLLGGVLYRLRRLADAESVLTRVVALQEGSAQGWVDLGLVQQRRDRLKEAEHSLLRACELDPRRADAWVGLGTVRVVAGRHQEALAAFRKALEIDENDADALAGLGHVLKTVGDQDGAVAAYRRCLAAHPADGLTYWALADLKTFRFDDRELQAMRRQVATGSLTADQRIGMLFALGTALDQRQDFDGAFGCFERGNALRRRQQHYDSGETERFHDRLMEVFSRDFLAGRTGTGNPDPAPIFIVGLPRSGSTLIEQILASHRDVDATYELPELGQIARSIRTGQAPRGEYPDAVTQLPDGALFELGTRYLDRTRSHRRGARRFTDKMPNNFVHVGLLSLILPQARIINVRRHPLDTCLSCYMQLFAHGQPFACDLRELGEYYLQYQRLMDHWHAVLPGTVLDLQYEDLVADFPGQLRRLLDYCDLPWDDGCLRFHENRRAVRSASSEQVRQPLYARARHRWRDYEKHLGPLIGVIEPLLRALPDSWRPAGLPGAPPAPTSH